MSYKKKTYLLKWDEGHPLHGLEISIKGLSIGDLDSLTKVMALAGGDFKPEDLVKLDPVIDLITSKIVWWNYEDDNDEVLPITRESVKSLDISDLVPAIEAWMQAVMGVQAPLERASNSGETSLAELSMEPLS